MCIRFADKVLNHEHKKGKLVTVCTSPQIHPDKQLLNRDLKQNCPSVNLGSHNILVPKLYCLCN